MPRVGYGESNGVLVVGEGRGRKLFDDLTPTHWYSFPSYLPNYESVEVQGVEKFVNNGDDVIVIGGGFGVTAVHAAINNGGRGQITVYEADRERFENLTEIFEANGVSDCVEPIFGQLGNLHIKLDDPAIPSISYEDIPMADIWDMDCEGAEVEILQNLPYNPSVILVETHDNHDEVTDLLESNGYELLEIIRKSEKLTHIRARAT